MTRHEVSTGSGSDRVRYAGVLLTENVPGRYRSRY